MNPMELYKFVTVDNSGELQTEVWNIEDKLQVGTIFTESEMADGVPLICGIRCLKEYLTYDDLEAFKKGYREHVVGVIQVKRKLIKEPVNTE